LLKIPKPVLTLSLEVTADRFVKPLLDGCVGVCERQRQTPRQLPAYRGFSAAGHPDESNQELWLSADHE
jgi:hypothetical protein